MRWTARRKAEIIEIARRADVDRALLLATWEISEEEFASWERLFDQGGRKSLRATRLPPRRGGIRHPNVRTGLRRRRAIAVSPPEPLE